MADDFTRRRPISAIEAVHVGQLRASPLKAQKDLEEQSPDKNWGLGLAKVTVIDYEEFYITLRTIGGASQTFERVPVPITFPGAGARHFFGAMPEVGDICVIGWMTQESAQPDATRTPVILGWIIPGVMPGRDWVTTAEFEVDEYDMDAPREQHLTMGAYDRVRHKLRHIQPGNIVASSGQGADLVLDEGVTLSNRRGNEFRLRDQDQAAITRALQRFDALAGTRVYAGMVQRDATFLAAMMISDGYEWDGGQQAIAGEPVSDANLPADSTAPEGFLTPTRLLRKNTLSAAEGYLGRAVLLSDNFLDPYSFLRRGGFINEAGFAVSDPARPTNVLADAVYGGKPIFRVAAQKMANAVGDEKTATLTEYRIEMTHTTDGRLPVTEQTDGFDADRLPTRDKDTGQGQGLPENQPFIEWVLGSVVGNDPYTEDGRNKYGLPIVPVIFDGNKAAPRLDAADIPIEGSGVEPTPIEEQAAYLFHMIPPTAKGGNDTFWAVNKQGQLKASIGGDQKQNSVEAYVNGNIKIGVGGTFTVLMDGHIHFGTLSKSSMLLDAPDGAVKIYGGGPLKDETATVERLSGTGSGDDDLPSVDIEAKTNMQLKAEKRVFVKGNSMELNATTINLIGHDQITMDGVKSINQSTENLTLSVNGKCQESYSGPKYMLPTNLPLHERTYVPFYPGMDVEHILYAMGNRKEIFLLGNHTTLMAIGNMTYTIGLGTWTTTAGPSALTMGPSGINAVAAVGVVSLTAASGFASMTGMAGASLVALGGPASVRGTAGVYLGGPITGPDMGPIICAGSLEPFTLLPFLTWGMGAKAHQVTA